MVNMDNVASTAEALAQIIDEICKIFKEAIKPLQEFFGEIQEIFISIDIERKERSKWRRMTPTPIRTLLLDKRSKIHRCRNAI